MSRKIQDEVTQTLIIAYKEDTRRLQTYLVRQGFDCQVVRQKYQLKYKDYSPSYLCLINHCEAWRRVLTANRPMLICEADFVPVKNLAGLPMPYDTTQPNVGIAWLYTCAPQIYSVSIKKHAIGFSTSMVAYILTPIGAQHLLQLAEQIAEFPGPAQYSTWDSTIENFFRQRGLDGYVAWRNYGDHGGRPNPEHRKAGLSPVHRADVLYGQLAFTPIYAEMSPNLSILYVIVSRLKARIKGLGRLALGKYLRLQVLQGSTTPLRLLKFAAGRQLTLRL